MANQLEPNSYTFKEERGYRRPDYTELVGCPRSKKGSQPASSILHTCTSCASLWWQLWERQTDGTYNLLLSRYHGPDANFDMLAAVPDHTSERVRASFYHARLLPDANQAMSNMDQARASQELNTECSTRRTRALTARRPYLPPAPSLHLLPPPPSPAPPPP